MSAEKKLGRYQIQSHLGTGAFADVYKALDTVLDRVVALKVLKPMLLADSEAFTRFTREAQVAANLFHPHIATVLDMGEAEGRYFIAMRYVDGKSLDKVLAERGALPWEEALKITEQIAGALQFAHDKGLVHRDVKPQNIIVSQSEGAVLTDFGLVKALHSSGYSSATSMIGTPAYIPPEIWEGKDATPASDQYALACVLVEMLTGKVLFDGKTPPAVMAKHFQPPQLPKTWPKGAPGGLENILLRVLAKEPADRYPSIREFLTALRASDDSLPEEATPAALHLVDRSTVDESFKVNTSRVPLRGYNREIENLIEGGRIDEAIAHCQHILKTFPMCVETYRLLGKAFLEVRRCADATDIFQRVLMAVPDDFVAHVGMSIIRDDEAKVDEAIWHMERAFEIQPSNPAIQSELKRLYGRRDGIEPRKVRLTRDALANMYSQGEVYNQAIVEIRSAMAEDANRADLQVMLARTYYRAGQKVEATEMSMTLLKKYPYCLDALRILVDILPGTGCTDGAQVYRQRVEQLDPYSAFVNYSVFQSDQIADSVVTLERLDYQTGEQPEATQPGWASSLGIKLESDFAQQAAPG